MEQKANKEFLAAAIGINFGDNNYWLKLASKDWEFIINLDSNHFVVPYPGGIMSREEVIELRHFLDKLLGT